LDIVSLLLVFEAPAIGTFLGDPTSTIDSRKVRGRRTSKDGRRKETRAKE